MKCLLCIVDHTHYFQLAFLGTSGRCKASRGRALGWKPKYTTEDLLKSIKGEVEWQLTHAPVYNTADILKTVKET
jgi:hypothetical protein